MNQSTIEVMSAQSHTPLASVHALMQQSTSPPQYGRRDRGAGDGDVAAGGVIGVLGHHRCDRQQRGRGDRHPLGRAQPAQGR